MDEFVEGEEEVSSASKEYSSEVFVLVGVIGTV